MYGSCAGVMVDAMVTMVVSVSVLLAVDELIGVPSLMRVLGTDESSRTLYKEFVATMLDASLSSLTTATTTGEGV